MLRALACCNSHKAEIRLGEDVLYGADDDEDFRFLHEELEVVMVKLKARFWNCRRKFRKL